MIALLLLHHQKNDDVLRLWFFQYEKNLVFLDCERENEREINSMSDEVV